MPQRHPDSVPQHADDASLLLEALSRSMVLDVLAKWRRQSLAQIRLRTGLPPASIRAVLGLLEQESLIRVRMENNAETFAMD